MGTDILFENHTIKEIQEIEKKLRNDIERKKEELRQMVGERYRDLMEAADTITEMKEIAESVTGCVKSIEGSCTQLQNSSLRNGILTRIQEDVAKKKKVNEMLYIIASQIKILMDSPTKIWSSIEDKNFTCAISLYLLARHTHSLLILDPIYREHNVLTLFPVINRQWTSINHFRHILFQECQVVLKKLDSEPEDVLGPLCCNVLLSNSSLQKICVEALDIRKAVLKSIFLPEKSAKDQICEFVTVVQTTLKIVYVLLYPDEETKLNNEYETNILHQTLFRLMSKEYPGPVSLLDLKSSETFKFLPLEITGFRPTMTVPLDTCTTEFLQSHCNEWLNEIQRILQPEMKSLLNFVNSVQNLSLIREAVIDKLCGIKHWDRICNDLLGRSFSIWDTFLNDIFWERIKNIINEQVKSASEFYQKDIEETLYEIGLETNSLEVEKNVSLYVWRESTEDIMDNIAWQPRHHRNYWNSGELSMKAMGFTPKVQSIAKDLDARLQNVLEDVSHFSCLQNEIQGIDRGVLFQELSLEISKDASDIYKYLTQALEKHLFDLSSYMETTLMYLEKESDSLETNCRIVFLGHVCYGVANLCPHINVCLSSEKLRECAERCSQQGSNITFPLSSFKENEVWKDFKKKLLELSSSSFRLWSKYQMQHMLNTLKSEFVPCSIDGLLRALLQWDKVEIQEESEQGNAVNSVLRIPQHISTPISNILFSFCCKLNAIGGFAINSEVRSSISKQLLVGLLAIYNQKMDLCADNFNSRLLQIQSLQMLFDVQFLVGLLVHKGNTCDLVTSSSQDIINKAVSHVDPFDMDVFSLPLQQNIKKALQKALSLFGLLTSPDQVSYLNSIKSHLVGSQMDHNIMLISNSGGRFPLLPLSSKANAMTTTAAEQLLIPPKVAEVKNLQSHNSSPNLSASDLVTNPMKSATSFYDKVTTAMTSSWFGN